MKMDGWEDHLHTSFYGEHVLFAGLRLTSFGTFISAAILSAAICLIERLLTFALSRNWAPFRVFRQSRVHNALWRAGLYAAATLLRLLYMLLSMTFHVWLILIIVLSLAAGQFIIDYFEHPHNPDRRKRKSRSKPVGLFIHPNDSNLARADAVAVELGLHGSAERVKGPRTSSDSDVAGSMWEQGRGRDAARALLGSAKQVHMNAHAHSRSDSQQKLFQVGDSGSESDD
ncbi:hypothetical protein B0F90DRAFT_162270 [Multifurca ochricompacta]|uniref:Copper transport protein n=1 Tax=Multifurca ochricompacta TaxID=376703 RepID=A0AAD4MHS7_9AGAM|nr:hypothetical protein B0F90DRAFT_162270 [Multifurca ochricompacta]